MTYASSTFGYMLLTAVQGGTDAVTNMMQFMTAIGNYISTITFSGVHNGEIPGTPPVPVVNFPCLDLIDGSALSSSIVFCGDPGGGDGLSQWESWIDSVYLEISTKALVIGGTSIVSGIPAFPSLSRSWSRDILLNSFNQNPEDSSALIFDNMASAIIGDLMIGFVNSYPCLLSSGSVGVTSVTSVSCP